MSHFVELDTAILHRYICKIVFINKPALLIPSQTARVPCIIDTACINTLVPLHIAKVFGTPLNKIDNVVVGAKRYSARLYSFDNVMFGSLKIPKMIGFAAVYEGDIARRVLLGLNFLNNLKITLDRRSDTITFSESIPDFVKHTEYPFTYFFEKPGLKPVYPNLLEEAVEEK